MRPETGLSSSTPAPSLLDLMPHAQQGWQDVTPYLQADGSLAINLPLLDVHGYWHPLRMRPAIQQDWAIRFTTSANHGFPLLTLFNAQHEHRLSLGLSNLMDDTQFAARMDQTTHSYRLVIRMTPDALKNTRLWLDATPGPWTQAVARYRAAALTQSGLPTTYDYPASAWDPVYCTWYSRHRRLTAAWVEAEAAIAADMGFGTFILDDGWSCKDASTVGADISQWYAPIGDWLPDEGKFPDYAGHVARVRATGLKYMLWVAPLMLGMDTPIGQRWHTNQPVDSGFYNADPNNAELVQDIYQQMERLLKLARIDGLKVDFLDSLVPSPDAPLGQAMRTFMTRLADIIREHCDTGLIEYRQCYTGLASLGTATNFRSNDSPYDFLENLQRIAQIRVCLGDGIPVHADPVYWHPQETLANIHRHMIAAIAGVPMVSMDLAALSPEVKRIITYWLETYRQWKPLFSQGQWQVIYHVNQVAAIIIRQGDQQLALVYDDLAWPGLNAVHQLDRGVAINGSGGVLLLPAPRQARDEHGQQVTTTTLATGWTLLAT